MGDPRDRIDTWLHAEVEPLAPPPGTFERIRHRARRRKASRVMMSTAGVVIVIAAAVAVPRIASTMLQSPSGGSGQSVAAGAPSPTPHPVTSGGNGGLNANSGTKVPHPTSSLSAAGSGDPVPASFRPTSVTFVGAHIGAVIGQAGTSGHCATAYCTSLAGTSDYGASWYGVSAPLAGPPDGALGVSQVRFLTTRDGWAFGPQLWVTHDGGAHWAREQTYGLRVTDLETAGNRAFAVFASCTGTGKYYAAGCTKFSLYSSPATSNEWRPVTGPAANLQSAGGGGAGQAASASLVLVGGPGAGTGYLLAPSGELFSGSLTGGPWTATNQQLPCQPGPAGPDGQPTGALLAADSTQLVLVCTSAASAASDTQTKTVVESSDRGQHWSNAGTAPAAGIAASLSTQAQGNLIVLATDAGIYLSGDGGSTWKLTQASPSGAAAGEAGFSYLGMTSPTDGVALPADPGLHEVFITTDGGGTWQAYPVSAA